MSSSNKFSWEPLFNSPNPPLAGLAHNFEGYSFNTSGFGEDLEVEITQLPSERTKAVTTDAITSVPSSLSPFLPSTFDSTSYPLVDLSSLPTYTPARTPDTLAISHPPPATHPTPLPAPFVIRNINVFLPFPGTNADFQYPPARPDEFRIAANTRKHALNNETRRAIGNSGIDKENPVAAADESAKLGKSKFNGNDLIGLACTAIDCNPWLVAYKKKEGFCHPNMNATTLQHKCKAIISFKKDPKGKNKNLAKVIGVGKSAALTIAALLERMETQYDEVKDKSDDTKAVIKKKNNTDREGGEAIRQASLHGMRCKYSPTPESDDSDATEPEVDEKASSIGDAAPDADAGTPATTPKMTSASSSVEIIDGTKDKKPTKCRHLHDRRSALGTDALIDLFWKNQCHAEHNNRVAMSLNTFVKDSHLLPN
ncbi:hypothetical protein DFH08DRAFT_806083 [Mycena albidolilacea]|uniref:Uncharacterized protein n=1 Tax=Mycena albidolilacea TaxID=1033008 RepID=A0AAD7A8G5_9AGAR|nr:hypothetical protein DFH08DRAFT_806083 [Mycena albidolilacea]